MTGTIWKSKTDTSGLTFAGEYLLIIEECQDWRDGFFFLSTAELGLCWIDARFLMQNYE